VVPAHPAIRGNAALPLVIYSPSWEGRSGGRHAGGGAGGAGQAANRFRRRWPGGPGRRAARARGEDPGELLPAVHRVASLARRWLLGTHQGSVDEAHLPAYLDEFIFRFNRRRSASRGMVFYRLLELAAGHDPVRFQDLLASKKPHAQRPQPPAGEGPPAESGPPAGELAMEDRRAPAAAADITPVK